jgi:hypothetical protein
VSHTTNARSVRSCEVSFGRCFTARIFASRILSPSFATSDSVFKLHSFCCKADSRSTALGENATANSRLYSIPRVCNAKLLLFFRDL